jgi:hypothetical protein
VRLSLVHAAPGAFNNAIVRYAVASSLVIHAARRPFELLEMAAIFLCDAFRSV